jgi:prefoldin subunit 5
MEMLADRLTRLERRHDRLEASQEHLEQRIGRVEQTQAATTVEVNNIKDDIRDIKEGQKWNNRYAIGALVTTILTMLTIWATLAAGWR